MVTEDDPRNTQDVPRVTQDNPRMTPGWPSMTHDFLCDTILAILFGFIFYLPSFRNIFYYSISMIF